jgi:hypothetical protein
MSGFLLQQGTRERGEQLCRTLVAAALPLGAASRGRAPPPPG